MSLRRQEGGDKKKKKGGDKPKSHQNFVRKEVRDSQTEDTVHLVFGFVDVPRT